MGKKKNTAKKHKFKHVESVEGLQAQETSRPGAAVGEFANKVSLQPNRPTVGGVAQRDFGYVGGDLRRIGVLAGSLVALEAVLYYILVYTSAGAAIYNLVKV